MTDRKMIIDYIEQTYDISPDYIFEKSPNDCVFRQKRTKKWFALLVNVPKATFYPDQEGKIDIVNVKVIPEIGEIIRKKEGFLPAYHMNKKHWLSINIEKIANFEEITDLIDDSFELTKQKNFIKKQSN